MGKPAGALTCLEELEGWLTLGEAAVRLKVSVERVRQLATEDPPRIKTARRLGQRPIGIVREAEINEMAERKSRTGSFFEPEPPAGSIQRVLDAEAAEIARRKQLGTWKPEFGEGDLRAVRGIPAASPY